MSRARLLAVGHVAGDGFLVLHLPSDRVAAIGAHVRQPKIRGYQSHLSSISGERQMHAWGISTDACVRVTVRVWLRVRARANAVRS